MAEQFTPRTPAQIVARMEGVEASDAFGTIQGDLLYCLPFEDAKRWIKDDVTPDVWAGLMVSADAAEVKARMLAYMPFAWGKANDERGLSAARSLDHMSAWLWLLGEDAAAEAVRSYSHYGKPHLRAICERYGWDWRQWDDGQWEAQGSYRTPEEVEPAEIFGAPAEVAP